MFIENYLTKKGLYDEALEYVEDAMEAHGELPFEWISQDGSLLDYSEVFIFL
jgi:hypothetical protein